MSVQEKYTDLEELVRCEKQRLEEAEAQSAEEAAHFRERFRVSVASALARMSSPAYTDNSICIRYMYTFDVDYIVKELVSRGHYVIDWHWVGACYPGDLAPPSNYLQVFVIGVYPAGNTTRTQLSSCELL